MATYGSVATAFQGSVTLTTDTGTNINTAPAGAKNTVNLWTAGTISSLAVGYSIRVQARINTLVVYEKVYTTTGDFRDFEVRNLVYGDGQVLNFTTDLVGSGPGTNTWSFTCNYQGISEI
jgi:hypothetical protein